MASAVKIDKAAIGFSFICLVHCALLPLLAVSMPFFGVLAEAEWVHWLSTLLAIGAATATVLIAYDARTPSFLVPAFAGVTLLLLALGAEPLGFEETLPTVSGALLLASAHLYRIYRNH